MSPDHIQLLIADYLAKHYPSVLPSFLSAAHIALPLHPPQPDLETLIADIVSLEAVQPATTQTECTLQQLMMVQAAATLNQTHRTLEGISAANLLTVHVQPVPRRNFDTSTASYQASHPLCILTSSVDKSLRIIDYSSGEVERIIEPHRAAVLSFALHPRYPRYLITGSMDGTAVLTDLITSQTLQVFRSNKFVVRVAFSSDGTFFATASYDHSIVIYKTSTEHTLEQDDALDPDDDPLLAGEPTLRYVEQHRIKVDSNPEAVLFYSHWLIYSLRSSHLLFYVDVLTGKTRTKSLNVHPADTHQSFAVLNMALHPSGRIIALQTGDNKGAAGERILFYGAGPEEAERLGCVWTGSEGDDFVLPRMSWLPDGSALVTTTPHGHLHLVDLAGEVRSRIKVHGAREGGQASSEVVRDCCVVQIGDNWEVVSVGYDRRVRISR